MNDGDIWVNNDIAVTPLKVEVGEQSPITTGKECPYGAGNCPKTEDIKIGLDKINKALSTLTKIVYVITGIMFVKFGVMLW